MSTAAVTVAQERVWEALSTVRDPELDRPITELGFVTEATVREQPSGRSVLIRLRLPTYFCAPNFAYLMTADAHAAVRALPGTEAVEVRLEDHFAADEINAAVAARTGFKEAFPRQAKGELAELRLTFLQKGYLAAQGRLGKRLTERGWTVRQMAEARLRDLPDDLAGPLVRRRRALDLASGGDEPVFTDELGRGVLPAEVESHLKRGRTTAVGIAVNTELCEGLLATRYGPHEPPAEVSATSRDRRGADAPTVASGDVA
ncbi:iron-sulfur cluster assembly protein [Streptomyces sp. NPDC005799]|uniref:metal-sulfur cluster assembly factor n=1 Tax=Streptomyces sp. NPDC005799 TaxID=3154678 RepID=UPI00340A9BF3